MTSEPGLELLVQQLYTPWNSHRAVRVKPLEDCSHSNVPHPVAGLEGELAAMVRACSQRYRSGIAVVRQPFAGNTQVI